MRSINTTSDPPRIAQSFVRLDVESFPDTDYKAYYWSRTPETRDAFRNMMSETTVQPEDIEINNAHENAFFQEYMLGGNWRGPRRMEGLARSVRYPK